MLRCNFSAELAVPVFPFSIYIGGCIDGDGLRTVVYKNPLFFDQGGFTAVYLDTDAIYPALDLSSAPGCRW